MVALAGGQQASSRRNGGAPSPRRSGTRPIASRGTRGPPDARHAAPLAVNKGPTVIVAAQPSPLVSFRPCARQREMRWHRRHRAPSPSPSGARATHPHRPRLLSPAGERAALGPAPPCFLLPPFPSYCDIVPSFISGHHSSRVHSFTQRYHTFTPVTLYIVRTRPLSPLGLLPHKQNHTTQRSPPTTACVTNPPWC